MHSKVHCVVNLGQHLITLKRFMCVKHRFIFVILLLNNNIQCKVINIISHYPVTMKVAHFLLSLHHQCSTRSKCNRTKKFWNLLLTATYVFIGKSKRSFRDMPTLFNTFSLVLARKQSDMSWCVE